MMISIISVFVMLGRFIHARYFSLNAPKTPTMFCMQSHFLPSFCLPILTVPCQYPYLLQAVLLLCALFAHDPARMFFSQIFSPVFWTGSPRSSEPPLHSNNTHHPQTAPARSAYNPHGKTGILKQMRSAPKPRFPPSGQWSFH